MTTDSLSLENIDEFVNDENKIVRISNVCLDKSDILCHWFS